MKYCFKVLCPSSTFCASLLLVSPQSAALNPLVTARALVTTRADNREAVTKKLEDAIFLPTFGVW